MNEDTPKESAGDHGHALARAGLRAVPFAGPALVELLNKVIVPPVSRRTDAWRLAIAERLDFLEKENRVDLEQLSSNEHFITVFLQASQIAIRNHEIEKLDALKEAVTNTALKINIQETLQLIFLNLIDSFSPWHIQILHLFSNPTEYFLARGLKHPVAKEQMEYKNQLLISAFPDLAEKESYLELVENEIDLKGLTEWHDKDIWKPGMKMTSELADEFLIYIRSYNQLGK